MSKPILVGELNPYGAGSIFALYPAPPGCTGHRLCYKILGMSSDTYLDRFDRYNLCQGKWRKKDAVQAAAELIKLPSEGRRRFILLGVKVAGAFGYDFKPYTLGDRDTLMLPHPSGLNRLWHEAGSFERVRAAVLEFCPDLADVIGALDRKAVTECPQCGGDGYTMAEVQVHIERETCEYCKGTGKVVSPCPK